MVSCWLPAVAANLLCDALGTRCCQSGRVAFVASGSQSRFHDRLKFGDKIYVGCTHVGSSDSYFYAALGQELFQVGYRYFCAVEDAGSQCTVDIGVLEYA